MGSEPEVLESMLQRLRDVRQSLLRLHKALLQCEREDSADQPANQPADQPADQKER